MKASLAIDTAAKFILAVIVIAVVVGLIIIYVIGGRGKIDARQAAMDACEKLKTNYGCDTNNNYFTATVTVKCYNAGYDACNTSPQPPATFNPASCMSTCCAGWC